MVEFCVPIAPSGNRMWRHTKNGIVYKTNEARKYQEQVAMIASTAKHIFNWEMATDKIVIEYIYYWPDKRKRDTGNQKKVINDALQGVIVDNDNNILERDIDWLLDRDNPRIELKIWRKDDTDVRNK
jgi:crossover junction endodeoxyribonuclease RusA